MSQLTAFKSQLMVGNVRHRRLSPIKHSMTYPLFMPCLDLDEIDLLERKVWGFGQRWWHWARFQRSDYLGDGNLKQAVQDKVHELTDIRLTGRVVAVCHLRYLGLYFSPVNFYYLYDDEGRWCYLLAEVSNTPWNERHYYAIPADKGGNGEGWQHDKAFHVSPFNPMDQQYVWCLKPLSQRLMVHLECHQERKIFDATLSMQSQPFNSKILLKHLIKTPIMAVKVMVGIYWQALKLWLKGAPFYSH
ncbi:chromosome partitioning protein ParA [Vibrio sp. 10N.286.49.B3]|uniref:DUF1365 domain-containing protein n=1 Tax=Vibrio sp. 10N.286.49.B3 TaxID=1880855 RepID=UPI000C8189DF|nr:DUF1365 family protein [Vibrio sp. 10N.286.49.B3]PMH46762.1 chromosome partitioning protein ParA [Vibrio sp. 10N.286.49.B3]